MAKKKANELKQGDSLVIAGKKCVVSEIEKSDIGKQGAKKVRIVAKTPEGEALTLIRPEDYPFEVV